MRLQYQAIVIEWEPDRAVWIPLTETFMAGVKTATEQARADAPLGETGRLKKSIDFLPTGPFGVVMSADAQDVGRRGSYAASQEFGSQPHYIRAKRKPALVFWWERMGMWFIGPRVWHPGTGSTPEGRFLTPNAKRTDEYMLMHSRTFFR